MEQPESSAVPEESHKTETNNAAPPTQTSAFSSSIFTPTSTVDNGAAPSYSNFMNSCIPPTIPAKYYRASPAITCIDYQTVIEHLLAKLHDWISKAVDVVSSQNYIYIE